jgi:hypothetical protein
MLFIKGQAANVYSLSPKNKRPGGIVNQETERFI